MSMLSAKITPLQCRDTALALTFLALLIWFFTKDPRFAYAGMGITLLAMIWPSSMIWPARLWFGFSHVLGSVMSRVLLSIIYVLLLLPMGLVRRCMGKDALRLRWWKDGKESAFVAREHAFSKDDLTHPY